MAYVKAVPYEEAQGEAKEVYDQLLQAPEGVIGNVYAASSLRPHLLRTLWVHNRCVMESDSGVSPAERQMIAAVVSAINKCQY